MSAEGERAAGRRRLVFLLPLAAFLALAAVFLVQLFSGRDTSFVPSALIGKPAPQTELPPLEGLDLPGLSSAGFRGKVVLLADDGLGASDCRLEWADGGAERKLERIWNEVEELVRRALHEPHDAPTKAATAAAATN